jgi:polyprenyl-phospho-N-acetylgalactosaminyl synthase
MNEDTWLVVPLFNEEQVIGDVVTGALERFSNVVCIDDGSHDRSGAAAAEAGAVVVRHPINLGQGAALQTGLSYALTDPGMSYVVTFDADGQHQVSDAEDMVAVLRDGAVDVVFGSRFLESTTRPPALKRALLKAAVAYSNASTHVRLTDTHNGLRALSRKAVELLDIRQNRMAHASEIIDQIGKARLPYVEHPVHILYTDYSRAKGQSLLNSVNILAELIYR